jgi:type IV secretory pathway TrbD component
MATVTKNRPPESRPSKQAALYDADLRRQRITGFVVLVVLAAIFGLLIWLASISEVPSGIEHWPMMPY